MIAIIGREDEVAGFALCGVVSRTAKDAVEAAKALRELAKDATILIITGEFADALRSDIEEIEAQENAPIVVEIPGRHHDVKRDRIRELIKRTIGVELRG